MTQIYYHDKNTGAYSVAEFEPTLQLATILKNDVTDCVNAESGDANIQTCVPGLQSDIVQANPMRGKNGIPAGHFTAVAAAGASTILVRTLPNIIIKAGTSDSAIVIGEHWEAIDPQPGYEGLFDTEINLVTVAVQTTVTDSYIDWTLTVAVVLSNTYSVGAVAVQPQIQKIGISSMGNAAEWGLRYQLQRPDAPTLTLATDPVVGTSVDFTVTLPLTNKYFANYAAIWIYETEFEAKQCNHIETFKADSADTAVDAGLTVAISAITTYKGGATTKDGGNLASGTYWAVALLIAKADCRCAVRSLPSTPLKVIVP